MIKLLIFEDDAKFRKSMEMYWKDGETISVEATFPDGYGASRQVFLHQPNVVLMDIEMPSVNGITALTDIKAKYPATKVMILTTFQDDDKIFAAICAGADGYMLKGEDIENIEAAIEDVHNEGAFMTPSIARRVMKLFKAQNSNLQAEFIDLSEREMEVLRCLSEGKKREAIGKELFIATVTVGDHTKSIYKKLHVNSALKAVSVAKERKIL